MGWKLEGPIGFKHMLQHHLQNGVSDMNCFVGDYVGIQCVRCHNITPIKACPNCGSPIYGLGLSPSRQTGLFCAQCSRGFTNLTCSCGCENAVNAKTLTVKDEVTKARGSKLTVDSDGSVQREESPIPGILGCLGGIAIIIAICWASCGS